MELQKSKLGDPFIPLEIIGQILYKNSNSVQ